MQLNTPSGTTAPSVSANPGSPRVVGFNAVGKDGKPVRFTIGTDIIDHIEAARAFGRDDLADPQQHGRYQPRMIAIPDRKQAVIAPMTLTIGSQNSLSLVRKDAASPGGWQRIDLSSAFAQAVGANPQVRALGAAWTDDDRITIAVAVDNGTAQAGSRVFVAYDLSSKTTDWNHIPWKDCGTRQNVRVEGIRVLDEGDKTWTIVLGGSGGPKEMLYLLRSRVNRQFADALVFNPAVQLQEVYDFEVGAHPVFGGGLHILGMSGGVNTLSFRPFPTYDAQGRPDTPPVVALPCPTGARALQTGLTGENGSDLYIGGQGVQMISAAELDNAGKAKVTSILGADAAPNAQALVVGDNSDGSAAVWCLLQNGDLIVAKRKANQPFGASLLLRSGVQEIAPVRGDNHVTTSLLVVYADSRAACIRQDTGTGVWQEEPIRVADPSQLTSVTCYATCFRVLDEASAPRPGVKATVSASALASVEMNGAAAYLAPDVSSRAVTDMNGSITIYDRVRSLTPAIYRFAVEGIDGYVDVNPASGVQARFQTITADDLRNATATTGGVSTPLLPDNYRAGADRSQVDALAGALNHVALLAKTTNGAVEGARQGSGAALSAPFSSALRLDTVADGFQWGIQADAKGVRPVSDSVINQLLRAAQSAEQFFVNLGNSIADFFEGVGKKIAQGVTFVLHKTHDAFEFVCQLGDKIKRFALKTLEEIGSFFTWLWSQVKIGLEKLWDFLKFLFDWNDILLVRNAMVQSTDMSLMALKKAVGGMKDPVTRGFGAATQQIAQWRAEIGTPPAALPHPTTGTAILDDMKKVTQPVQELIDKVTGSSVVSWVLGKMDSIAADIVQLEGPNPLKEALDAAESFVTGVLADEAADLLTMCRQIQADVAKLFNNKMPSSGDLNFTTIKNLVVAVGTDVVVGLLNALRDLLLRSIDLMQAMVQVVRDALFARIRFPFIEQLVHLVAPRAKVDASFRLIDGLMLLFAVPATLAYKLMFDSAPLKKGDVLTLPSGSVTVQAGVVDTVKKFTWMGGLVAAFFKLGLAGKQAYEYASVATGARESVDPPSTTARWVGVGFSAIGVAAEFGARDTDQGSAVSDIEYAMMALSSLIPIKNTAMLIYEMRTKKALPQQAQKAGVGVDLACYITHFILRTAVYGIMMDSHKDDSGFKTEESLAWFEATFDHTGSSLMAASGLLNARDPEEAVAMALLLGGGAGCRGIAFITNLSRVLYTGKVQHALLPA